MKRAFLFFFPLLLTITPPARAEKADITSVQLPWVEFQHLLGLNGDTVSLSAEEYARLLRQAGVEPDPALPAPTGKITLTRQEFRRLLDQMQTPASADPASLTSASYIIRIGSKFSRVAATLTLEVSAQNNRLVRWPIFPASAAFEEIRVDGRAARVETDNGSLYLVSPKPGAHTVTLSFSLPQGARQASDRLMFGIPKTPITSIEIVHPTAGTDITVDGASALRTQREADGLHARGNLPTTESITVAWNPTTPVENKGPAKIYTDVRHLLTIEEGALRAHSLVNLTVLQNAVSRVTLTVPSGWTVVNVQGDNLGEWKTEKDNTILTVPFTIARSGLIPLTVELEQAMKDRSAALPFDGVHVAGAVRETGFLAVEAKTNAEANASAITGLTRVDVQELPADLTNLAMRPLLMGFRLNDAAQHLVLDIERHEDVPVVSTTIDLVNAVTYAFKDGTRIHQVSYQLRNNWKQFLELTIPDHGQVWSVFVQNQPVKPMKKDDRHILIPLNRSQANGMESQAFTVEVLFFEPSPRFPWLGRQTFALPMPDIVISQAFWSLYLPTEQNALGFFGNVDKEKAVQGVRPLFAALGGTQAQFKSVINDKKNSGFFGKRASVVRRSEFDGVSAKDEPANQEMFEQASAAKLSDNVDVEPSIPPVASPSGIQPVRVSVPATGKLFRFTKDMIVNGEPLTLTVVHVHDQAIELMQTIVALFLGILIYHRRAALLATVNRMAKRIPVKTLMSKAQKFFTQRKPLEAE